MAESLADPDLALAASAPDAATEPAASDEEAAAAASDELFEEIRGRALKLLGRREHSRLELARKLRQRGYPKAPVEAVIESLVANGLLSEERLIAAYVSERLGKGFGPLRIRAELREKGLSEEAFQPYLELEDQALLDGLTQASRKRFGEREAEDRREQAKRARFLEYRGFPPRLIARFLHAGPMAGADG
ncbi:MAG: regulatory protein RecX [Halochromatium sp.]